MSDNKKAAAKTDGKSRIAKAAAAPRVAPQLTTISAAVAMPDRRSRGGRSLYPFESLAVGQSFGVKNKTAKQIASVVSAANRRGLAPKRDANGAIVYKMQTIKTADGTEKQVPSQEPETFRQSHYIVADVDPKADPDGASARVWRDQ
ncbi:MAG TPA: hypothetical protein PK205_07190 [Promineifilum sp.]|nr:hypothetical protein [Promineifilum sp.]